MSIHTSTHKPKNLVRFIFWGFLAIIFLFVQNFFYHIYYNGKHKFKQGKAPFWKFVGFTIVTLNLACLGSFWDQAKDMVPKIYHIS